MCEPCHSVFWASGGGGEGVGVTAGDEGREGSSRDGELGRRPRQRAVRAGRLRRRRARRGRRRRGVGTGRTVRRPA